MKEARGINLNLNRSKNLELIRSDLDERIQEFYDYIVVE